MNNEIFVNLPVKDLNRTMAFWTDLGYTFNKQFTDEKAACLVIGENIYAMLLTEAFFKNFTKKQIADTSTTAEAIIALSVQSRKEVDDVVRKAVDAGATTPNDPQDHGFMYGWGFQDPDGHLWEVFYMEPSYVEK